MELLDTFTVHHPSADKHIRLYRGDLSAIPAEEKVDVLVLSAFPDDYLPTSTSLIGALDRGGVSVAALARDKAVDLRHAFSCWLSKDVSAGPGHRGFHRILCFEPLTRGRPAEVVGDIFRSIMPFALGDPPIRSLAMPIVASGDQGADPALMLAALFDAAVHWLAHGLPLEVVKIVVYSREEAERMRTVFSRLKAGAPRGGEPPRAAFSYDCFVSYSHNDAREVDALIHGLKAAKPGIRVFQDRLEIRTGDAWQTEIDRALESCRKVIAVYSPFYLRSKICMEEFNMARLRHRESESGVLLPIYLRHVDDLPLYMRTLHYIDCREGDLGKVGAACQGPITEALA